MVYMGLKGFRNKRLEKIFNAAVWDKLPDSKKILYKFLFNFTLIFLQQLTSLIIFTLGTSNENFRNKLGELSIQDFSKYKLSTCIFFLLLLIYYYLINT